MRRQDVDASQSVAAAALAQTVLRVTVGVIMTVHGWHKLLDLGGWYEQVSKLGVPVPELLAPLAVAGELLGGIGLIFGVFTRLAAFGVMCVMIVAITTVHLTKGLLAEQGGFEYPLLILATSIYFLALGGGPVSVDALLRRRAYRRAIERDPRWQEPPYVPPVPEEALYDRTGRRIERDERGRPHRH